MFMPTFCIQTTSNESSGKGMSRALPLCTSIRSSRPVSRFSSAAPAQKSGDNSRQSTLAAEPGSEQPGWPGQPGSDIENAILGPNLRQLQQLA